MLATCSLSAMSHLVITFTCGSSSCSMHDSDSMQPEMNLVGSSTNNASIRYTLHTLKFHSTSSFARLCITGRCE